MVPISKRLAEFTISLDYNQVPEEVLEEAKRFLLDSLGCAIAATENEDMKSAHRYIRELGGKKQSTIIGYGEKTNAANATLMNSLLIRAMDYNDIYWEQDPSHPSDIIPAALSVGEWKEADGREILVGIVIAYEIEIRLCNAAYPGIREIGWHHASLSQFVSPLVAGRMMGLNEEQLISAVGISGSSHFTLGGVVAGALTNMKNTADPMAVEAGVRAAILSEKGYEGPRKVFEGKEGLFEVLNSVRWEEDKITEGLGENFYLKKSGYKAFPTEALTHQPITATLEVMEENNIKPDEVKEVIVETTTRGADILSDDSKYKPDTKETADHSLPYCIAVATIKGNVLPSDFEKEELKNKKVRNLLPRIKVVANKEIDRLFPSVKRAIVTVKTERGDFTKQEDHAKGRPERPLSDDELKDKFRANAEGIIGENRINTIIDNTLNLEKYKNIKKYIGELKW